MGEDSLFRGLLIFCGFLLYCIMKDESWREREDEEEENNEERNFTIIAFFWDQVRGIGRRGGRRSHPPAM